MSNSNLLKNFIKEKKICQCKAELKFTPGKVISIDSLNCFTYVSHAILPSYCHSCFTIYFLLQYVIILITILMMLLSYHVSLKSLY